MIGLGEMPSAKFVAYIGSDTETRAVRQWADGERKPPEQVVRRLRLAYQAAGLLAERDNPPVIQVWLQGMNLPLEVHTPARVLRDNPPDDVGTKIMAAAQAFTATSAG
ncbi:MAG: hypothetical protein H7248_01900 [Microbacteriaceae bacterium]|nr:hypothetical protein [Microbacteriaceae bacterium]